jgi:hypothetical protein
VIAVRRLLAAAHERGDVFGATMNRDGAVAFGTLPRRWLWQRRADSGERPGGALIRTATVLLFLLGLGLLAVSYAAQYRYVLAQRHQPAASVIEAGALDAGMAIFSLLALGLARAGLAAKVERALIVACAAGSAIMNYAAADAASPRSVLAFCLPPVFLAVVVDRVVVSVRRHVLGMRDGRSPWAVAGRIGLYGLRFLLSPWPTTTGLRRWVLVATPLPAAGAPAPAKAIAAASATEPPASPRPGAGTARQGTKTARFLALVKDRHGPLAGIGLDRVSPIAAELAPEVDLDPGSARTALGKAVKAARNGTAG